MNFCKLLQRLKAKIQKNRVNCDKRAKFGGVVIKIIYFQFFVSSSKFCRDKCVISHILINENCTNANRQCCYLNFCKMVPFRSKKIARQKS